MTGILLDENLPRRLTFIPSVPVILSTTLGESVTDSILWNYARERSMAILTKDADFSSRIMLSEPPPWIIHVRFGNVRLREFHALLERMWPQIEALLPAKKLISVYRDRIESIGD